MGAAPLWRGNLRLVAAVSAVAALAMAVSGCGGRASAARRPAARRTPAPLARVAIHPAASGHVRPDKGITVTATDGTIKDVSVRARGAGSVPGVLSRDGTSWRTRFALVPGTKYEVVATAANADGKTVTQTAAFTTLSADMVMTPTVNVADGAIVGVGEPITIQFDHPVADKAAVERSLVLRTSTPVTGAWHWFGSQEVDFRPQTYWPAHTRVSLDFHAAGLRAADGAYATQNLDTAFGIGNRQITIVDTRIYRLRYYLNGTLLWNWPESSGMHEIDPATGTFFDTESGTFVVLYKKNPEIMSSASVGIKSGPFFYPPTPVYYSVKFTPSGNYVHSAPWSVGDQGAANVSHGCVNLSPDRAALYYSRAQAGDVVVIEHSPVAATAADATDWMISWHQWLRGSDSSAFTTAGLP